MQHISLLKKIIVCSIAGILTGITVFRIGNRFLSRWIPVPVIAAIAGLLLFISLVYTIAWQRKENSQQVNSPAKLAFWQGVIRYSIAFDLAMFGFQKIFHLQFSTPLGKLDLPFSSFSGESLTWAYYGYSYAYACVIGMAQISGSLFLLFERTRLLGMLILFPVLSNIIFIDIFYRFEIPELVHALLLMAGVLYLVFYEYDRWKAFLLQSKSYLPKIAWKNRFLKNAVRLSVLYLPLALITLKGAPDEHPELTGKYEVKKISVNNNVVDLNSCRDSVLTVVYFDIGNDLVLEFNSQQRRLFGTYHFDKKTKQMEAAWRYPENIHDTLDVKVELAAKGKMNLSGKIGRNLLNVELLKVNHN